MPPSLPAQSPLQTAICFPAPVSCMVSPSEGKHPNGWLTPRKMACPLRLFWQRFAFCFTHCLMLKQILRSRCLLWCLSWLFRPASRLYVLAIYCCLVSDKEKKKGLQLVRECRHDWRLHRLVLNQSDLRILPYVLFYCHFMILILTTVDRGMTAQGYDLKKNVYNNPFQWVVPACFLEFPSSYFVKTLSGILVRVCHPFLRPCSFGIFIIRGIGWTSLFVLMNGYAVFFKFEASLFLTACTSSVMK
jgi:hypothetical protein